MFLVLSGKEMLLRPQAFGESLATVPYQNVEEQRSESGTPLCKIRGRCSQTCDDGHGPNWPKFSSYSSSQKLDEWRGEEGFPTGTFPNSISSGLSWAKSNS